MKTLDIKNLTPHEVVVFNGETKLTIKPEALSARVSSTIQVVGSINVDGTPVDITRTTFGEVEGLPEEQDGVGYIVSRLVCEACPHRRDLYIPNGSVRDESGRIVGCTSLAQI